MRATPRTLLPAGLLLALGALLVTPLIAVAQSGLPATVTLHPEQVGPGAVVEVTGIDFPADEVVILELAGEATTTDLAVVMTGAGGYFSELVRVPVDVADGAWELRASALDGPTATHAFRVTGQAGEGGTAAGSGTAEAGLTSSRSSSGVDVVVMIIMAVMIAAVGGGAAYAWREVRSLTTQPGMGAGDDPIWSHAGAADELAPELTASGEPAWRRADQDG